MTLMRFFATLFGAMSLGSTLLVGYFLAIWRMQTGGIEITRGGDTWILVLIMVVAAMFSVLCGVLEIVIFVMARNWSKRTSTANPFKGFPTISLVLLAIACAPFIGCARIDNKVVEICLNKAPEAGYVEGRVAGTPNPRHIERVREC